MKKRGLFVFVLEILLVLFSLNTVSALFYDDGSQYQNVDSCGLLNTTNATYSLNSSFSASSSCIVIEASNITFDLMDNNITGNSQGIGINITSQDGVIVRNGRISNFSNTLLIRYSKSSNISDIKITLSKKGINISNVYNSTFNKNNIRVRDIGFYSLNSLNSTFSNSHIDSTNYSLHIFNSDYSEILNNTISNSSSSGVLLNLTKYVTVANNTFISSNKDYHLHNSEISYYDFSSVGMLIEKQFGEFEYIDKNLTISGMNFSSSIEISRNLLFLNFSKHSELNQSFNFSFYSTQYLYPVLLAGLTNQIRLQDSTSFTKCYGNKCLIQSFNSSSQKMIINSTGIDLLYVTNSSNIYSCYNLNISGFRYTILNNLTSYGSCLNISNSSIIVDGNNKKIISKGASTNAINIVNSSIVTISNITIVNSTRGIDSSNSGMFSFNLIKIYNTTIGLSMFNSNIGHISNFTIQDGVTGVFLNHSTYMNFTDFIFNNNTIAISLFNASSSNKVRFSNFYNISNYTISNNQVSTFDGQYNFLGNITNTSIKDKVLDFDDSSSYGRVDIDPYFLQKYPDTTAPVISISPGENYNWSSSWTANFTITSDDRITLKYKSNKSSGSWTNFVNCYTFESEQDGDGNCYHFNKDVDGYYIFVFNATNYFGLSTIVNRIIYVDYDEEPSGTVITSSSSSSPSSFDPGILSEPGLLLSRIWLRAGGLVEYEIDRNNFSITKVAINLQNEIRNVKITVKKLYGAPKDIPAYSKAVYHYFDLKEENIEKRLWLSTVVEFKVDKDWANQNEITDPNQISLYHYDNGWEELVTRFISESTQNFHFSADVPGFSYFAVAQNDNSFSSDIVDSTSTTSTTTTTSTTSTIAVVTTTMFTIINNEEQYNESNTQDVISPNVTSIKIFIFVIILATLIVFGVFYFKNIDYFNELIKSKITKKVDQKSSKAKESKKVDVGDSNVKAVEEPQPSKKKEELKHEKKDKVEHKKSNNKEAVKEKIEHVDHPDYTIEEIKEYAEKYLDHGFTKTEIKHRLLDDGISKKDITKIFKLIKK